MAASGRSHSDAAPRPAESRLQALFAQKLRDGNPNRPSAIGHPAYRTVIRDGMASWRSTSGCPASRGADLLRRREPVRFPAAETAQCNRGAGFLQRRWRHRRAEDRKATPGSVSPRPRRAAVPRVDSCRCRSLPHAPAKRHRRQQHPPRAQPNVLHRNSLPAELVQSLKHLVGGFNHA